jgi:predicted HTH domain antitoxin
MMESVRRVRKTDLARNTRQVINTVLRGQTAIVESHGQPEVAILDILDYRIIRAVMRYYAQRPEIDVESGLADERLAPLSDPQERLDLVLAHYLAGAISLGRAAELLQLPWLALRTHFLRLDVPLRVAPADLDEARQDIEAIDRIPISGAGSERPLG